MIRLVLFLFVLTFTLSPILAQAELSAEEGRALEEKILAEADKNIEKYRKSDAVIRIVNANGEPLRGVSVKVNQITSDFLFACNVTLITGELGGTIPIEHYGYKPRLKTKAEEEQFKARFAELFNCATIPLYWASLEPEAGQPDYSTADRILEWCKSQDIKVKGHTLVWVHGDNQPQWFRNLPTEEQWKALEKHVRDVVTYYKGKIDMWDVVNEAAWANTTLAGMTMHEYTSLPFFWARESDPDALLAINDAHAIEPLSEMDRFWNILTDFKDSDVPFDIIGTQAHINRVDRFRLESMIKVLKKLSTLGKPIHITEFTPCSDGLPIEKSWKQGIWTEDEQADYSVRFYRLCFSFPAVESIGWWDFTDYSAWQTGGGLLSADLSPKPVYQALRKLIREEWRTQTDGKTDEYGIYKFRGFHGKYDVRIELPDGSIITKMLHIQKGTSNELEIVISE